MPAKVTFHTRVLQELQQMGFSKDELEADLLKYFDRIKNPWYFGRDVRMDIPDSAIKAELWHMHLFTPFFKDGSPRTEEQWKFEGKRTCRQYYRTSDRWLIYTRGFMDSERYCVVGIADPTAHKSCNSPAYMDKFVQAAESFKNQY